MSRSIEEIIEAQGWNTDSVNGLLLRYIENQGSMDALSDFLERAAEEENGNEAIEPKLFKATIAVLVEADSETSARVIVAPFFNKAVSCEEGWLDWQYAKNASGQSLEPQEISEKDAYYAFPDYEHERKNRL